MDDFFGSQQFTRSYFSGRKVQWGIFRNAEECCDEDIKIIYRPQADRINA